MILQVLVNYKSYDHGGIHLQVMVQTLVVIQKASKNWLNVTEKYFHDAIKIFGTGAKITVRGRRHLGAIVGSKEYKRQYVSETVHNWIHEIERLYDITKAFSHEAYAAFVFGYQHKFTYLMRTVPDILHDLKPIEHVIRHKINFKWL